MKKIIALLLVVALTAALSVSLTLAYLKDEASDVNVMTLGNVYIEQIEQEWNADKTELVEFTQGKPLYPYVGTLGWADTPATTAVDTAAYRRFTMENVVDKYVSVKNTGDSPAYVRTFFAFEMGEFKTIDEFKYKVVGYSSNAENGKEFPGLDWIWGDEFVAQIDGKNYMIREAVHVDPLAPDATTIPSLLQVYMNKDCGNDEAEKVDGNNNGTYDILVFSQAVQTEGFKDAETALNTAFGDPEEGYHPWIDRLPVFPTMVSASTSEELTNAVKGAMSDRETIIELANGEYSTNFKVEGGKDITIKGNGKDTVLSGQIATTSSTAGTITLRNLTINVDNSINDSTDISQTGKTAIAIWGNQTVICENVTFNMSLTDSTAITSWWDTNEGTTIIVRNCTFNCNGQRPIRATGNVTVENTTFNDPYRYAVQLTAKASTATELDKAIINFNNNTIVDGENGKAFVYGIQLEGADYGCHDCVINGSGNTIKNGGTGSTMYYCECGKVDHDTITWNTEVTPVHEG